MMKTIRFCYNGKIVDKNCELFINEPRRYKMITKKIRIANIEIFMKNKFGIDYTFLKSMCEEYARRDAIMLDAEINGPIHGLGFEEMDSYI